VRFEVTPQTLETERQNRLQFPRILHTGFTADRQSSPVRLCHVGMFMFVSSLNRIIDTEKKCNTLHAKSNDAMRGARAGGAGSGLATCTVPVPVWCVGARSVRHPSVFLKIFQKRINGQKGTHTVGQLVKPLYLL
jgi:hypothetical protein